MRFRQEFGNNFNENICFGENSCSPGTFRENMCKRGASAPGTLQKFDAFAKNYLFLCKFSQKSKESIYQIHRFHIFAKIIKKTISFQPY
jgi:hypothetical protein